MMFHFVSKDSRSILKNCVFVLKYNHNIGKREGLDTMSLFPAPAGFSQDCTVSEACV